MFGIILANYGLWFNLCIPLFIGIYLLFHDKEYIWKELLIQVGATFVILISSFMLLFNFTTDLSDTEYWNGRVKNFEYFEKWTELVTYTESYECGSSKNPRTCSRTVTRHDYHAPYWVINTNNKEVINIRENQFAKASQEFGTKKENLSRVNQVSPGDGNKFISVPNKIIQTSVAHDYINYVVASNNIVKASKTDLSTLTSKVQPYPKLYTGIYGNTQLNRFINDSEIKVNYTELDIVAAILGSLKQVNPILYITKEDRSFKYTVESVWKNAKKNDCILLLGVDDNGTIQWSDSIAWTDSESFIVNSQNIKGNIKETQDIVNKFARLIENDYVRKSMKDFEYLTENIELEWYWQLLIFLINIVTSFFLFRYFRSN